MRHEPQFPTTQPLDLPVALGEAAHLTIDDPIYLCPRGDLWITRSDAQPTAAVLRTAAKEQVHILPERVRFVHWSVTDAGLLLPVLVIEDDQKRISLVTATARKPLAVARNYAWGRAFSWNDRIVVPADTGVALVDPATGFDEFQSLADQAAPQPVRALLDARGLLAWIPATSSDQAHHPVARYLDGKWHSLEKQPGWPDRIVELLPLLDGTVTQIWLDDAGKTQLGNATLDADFAMDEPKIRELVGKLSADEQADRDAAGYELSRYGPRVWPLLEKLSPDQPAEAQVRLSEIMSARVSPALGVFRPVAGDLRVVSYLRDGGVVLYSDAGVEMPRNKSAEPDVRAPAWLAIRPGRAAQLLPAALVADATPDRVELAVFGDEWIINDKLGGPARFMGNHRKPVLRAGEKEFSHFMGIDSRGRWLFRESSNAESRTLVIDRFLPDPTPRLPVWQIQVTEGDVGWTREGWPVMRKGGAWALQKDRWVPLKANDPVFTSVAPAATQQSVLWQDSDGTQFFARRDRIFCLHPGREQIEWTLPADANTKLNPVLIRAGANRLFWFDVGRVIRIKEAPDATQPFTIEAIFTNDIPNTDDPQRIWLDPAGRIVIAYDKNRLAILFPSGRVPAEIARMMPVDASDE